MNQQLEGRANIDQTSLSQTVGMPTSMASSNLSKAQLVDTPETPIIMMYFIRQLI